MEETRVSKYKAYRDSFITEGAISVDASDDAKLINKNTTTTLPIDEVIKEVNKNDDEIKRIKMLRVKKIMLYVAIGLGAAIVIVGLIVLGIFAWGN